MSLTAEQLKNMPLPVAAVDAPEYGDGAQVYVRTFPGTDVEQIDALGTGGAFLSRLAALALCDAEGARLFSDADQEAVGRLPVSLLRRVADEALTLNRLDQGSAKN